MNAEQIANIKEMKDNVPVVMESLMVAIHLLFKAFVLLQKEGFTEQQALEIIKSRGISLA